MPERIQGIAISRHDSPGRCPKHVQWLSVPAPNCGGPRVTWPRFGRLPPPTASSGLRPPYAPGGGGNYGSFRPAAAAIFLASLRKSFLQSLTASPCAPIAPSAGFKWNIGLCASIARGIRLR